MDHSFDVPEEDPQSAHHDIHDLRSRPRNLVHGTVAVPSLPGGIELLSRRQSAPISGDSPVQQPYPSPTQHYGSRIGQVSVQSPVHGYAEPTTRSHTYQSTGQWSGEGQPNQRPQQHPPFQIVDAHVSPISYPSRPHPTVMHDYASSEASNQRSSHFFHETSPQNTRVDIPPHPYQSPTSAGILSHDPIAARPPFAYSGPVGVRSSQACVACRKRKVRCTVIQSDMASPPGGAQGSVEKLCVRCSRLGIECLWKDERKGKARTRSQPSDTPEQQALTVDTAGTSQSLSNATSPTLSVSSTGSGVFQRQQGLVPVRSPSSPSYTSFPPGSASSDSGYSPHKVLDSPSYSARGDELDQHSQLPRASLNYGTNANPSRYSAPDPSIYSTHDLAGIRRTSLGNISRGSTVHSTPIRETALSPVAYPPVFYPYSAYGEQYEHDPSSPPGSQSYGDQHHLPDQSMIPQPYTMQGQSSSYSSQSPTLHYAHHPHGYPYQQQHQPAPPPPR